ncbi:Hypothetical predicted protein, partial [Pelobates cultripes]
MADTVLEGAPSILRPGVQRGREKRPNLPPGAACAKPNTSCPPSFGPAGMIPEWTQEVS